MSHDRSVAMWLETGRLAKEPTRISIHLFGSKLTCIDNNGKGFKEKSVMISRKVDHSQLCFSYGILSKLGCLN